MRKNTMAAKKKLVAISLGSCIKSVTYEELFNTGNYENIRIGCTVETSEELVPFEAVDLARDFVRSEYSKMKKSGIKFRE